MYCGIVIEVYIFLIITTTLCISSAGTDYTAIVDDLTFSAAVNQVCRNVSTTDDGKDEPNEQFELNLATTDGNVILNPDVATVTITDADGEPVTARILVCVLFTLCHCICSGYNWY